MTNTSAIEPQFAAKRDASICSRNRCFKVWGWVRFLCEEENYSFTICGLFVFGSGCVVCPAVVVVLVRSTEIVW